MCAGIIADVAAPMHADGSGTMVGTGQRRRGMPGGVGEVRGQGQPWKDQGERPGPSLVPSGQPDSRTAGLA